MYKIFTLENRETYPVIDDVVVHPFKVNRDKRGNLTEALKSTWTDVYDEKKLPFTQMYFSQTLPGVARDVDQWHFHPSGQQDRFFVIKGTIVVAILDARDDLVAKPKLNLFLMGEAADDKGQYLLLVPKYVYHGFMVVGDNPAILANFPTRLYDPEDEGRESIEKVKLADDSIFSWEKVKQVASDLSG